MRILTILEIYKIGFFMTLRVNSKKIYESLCTLIPGGVNSPARAFTNLGIDPLIISKGKKDIIEDVDGNTYIDYCQAWGSLILGHSPSELSNILKDRIDEGVSFGITTDIEEKIAKLIVSTIDSIEKIRFVNSGTEATMTAIRLARGFTKKNKIIKFQGNYHGHCDPLLVQAGSAVSFINKTSTSKGVPPQAIEDTICLEFNDISALEKAFEKYDDIAAVIIEPIAGNMGVIPATQEFLSTIENLTKKHRSLLVMDEVITGFRVHLKGAQYLYQIDPDITCLGKIIGAGFPVGAIGGKKEIMDQLAPIGEVYQAGTLSGNPLAMLAGYHAIEEISKPGIYELLNDKMDLLLDPIEEFINTNGLDVSLSRIGSMFCLFFGVKNPQCKKDLTNMNSELFTKFFQHLFANGIYFSPSPYESNFISVYHSDKNLIKTKDVILEFLQDTMIKGKNCLASHME